MLGRLRRSYSDLMDQSLQGVAWIELGLAEIPDAVQNATHLLLRVSNRVEQHLPPGTSITEAYDEAEHELLILGEPGAGKSTLLLDLARKLVMRAEQDSTHPLPVILPLSSWAIKRPKLEGWISEHQFYSFFIKQDGSYNIHDYTDSRDTVLAQGSSSAILRELNQTNLVAAVVHGTIIELYVNHLYTHQSLPFSAVCLLCSSITVAMIEHLMHKLIGHFEMEFLA